MRASITRLEINVVNGLCALVIFFLVGCNSEPDIRVYEVAKKPAVGTASPARILAAIVPHNESVFYIKATEEPSRLISIVDELKSVVEKVRFSASGEPEWTLPEGWENLPGSGISLATLQVSKMSPAIRFSVTVLGGPQSNWESYLEDNINRWRGQLALENVSLAEQRSSMTEIPREGEPNPAFIVDITGTRQEGAPSGMRAPFLESMGMAPPDNGISEAPVKKDTMPAPSVPDANAQSATSPLKYEAPSNWVFRGAGSFRLATFEVEKDGEKGEVSVSAARSNMADNAAMWQQQVDTDSSDEVRQAAIAQSLAEIEPIKFPSGDGQLLMFRKGQDDSAPVLLIAIIPTEKPEESLFVKLRSSLKLANAERRNLIDFATSIRW